MPFLFALLYLACLQLAGSDHPAAYYAACLGPVFGLLTLACILARLKARAALEVPA